MRYPFLVAAGLGVAIACGPPPKPLQVQGEVRARGTLAPIPRAEVLIQWPGAGQITVRTNAQGRYVVGRRARHLTCVGLAITVQANGFTSGYSRQTTECSDSVLTVDFTLFLVPS
jgi:hypothetical protein